MLRLGAVDLKLCGFRAVAAFGVLLLALAMAVSREADAGEAAPPSFKVQGKSSIHLEGAWVNSPPYQRRITGSTEGVSGLDVDILARVAAMTEVEVRLRSRTWAEQLAALADGRIDIAMGAYKPDAGDDRFYYSMPYRQSRLSFFVRLEDQHRYDTRDVPGLMLADRNLRLGFIPERLFQDARMNQALQTAREQGRALAAETDEENLRNLLDGRIDGFVADRLGIATLALEKGLKFRTSETILPGLIDVHFLLSKKTVTPEALAQFNRAIAELQAEGDLTKRFHAQVFSVIMAYAFDSVFFQALVGLAVITAALSGLLIAYKEGYSITGALVLATITALSGGVVRDLLLYRRPAVLGNPFFIELVILTVLLGTAVILVTHYLTARGWISRPSGGRSKFFQLDIIQEACDAAGLAAFSVYGVAVALSMDAQPLWLWGPICAMLTGAGGGIMRDMVRQAGHVATLRHEFYAEVPLFWGTCFSLFLLSRPTLLVPSEILGAIIVTVLGAFFTRMAVVIWRLKAPGFNWRRPSEESRSR